MIYLYIPYMMDGDTEYFTNTPPSGLQAEETINDELRVYRFNVATNQVETFTPIDNEDFDNWTLINNQP